MRDGIEVRSGATVPKVRVLRSFSAVILREAAGSLLLSL